MKIEKGKFYRARDGRKVGPMAAREFSSERPWGDNEGFSYDEFGRFQHNKVECNRDLIAEWTDEPDIFTVFEEYTSQNGKRWVCIAKQDGFAWLKPADINHATAYVWDINGKSVSLYIDNSYDIKPEQVVETVTLDGFTHNNEWFFREKDARKSHRINFTVIDGEPDCSSITMEQINDR